MGELIEGMWHRSGVEAVLSEGVLGRPPSVFRNWIVSNEKDPVGASVFVAERDRYHLYVSLASWAHCTLIMRSLKGLAGTVGISVVHWLMGEDGWTFDPGPNVIPDTVNGTRRLHQIYRLADPRCTSRVTVPVLWDKKERTIVSNESADILRMFNSAFGCRRQFGNVKRSRRMLTRHSFKVRSGPQTTFVEGPVLAQSGPSTNVVC